MTLSIALLAIAVVSSIGLHADEGPSPLAAWSLGSFGLDVGDGGIVVAGTGTDAEVYLTGRTKFDPPYFWHAIRYAPDTGNFEQVFLSEPFREPIIKIALLHTPVTERPVAIAVAFRGGVRIYDQRTKAFLGMVSPCSDHLWADSIITWDLNSDGWDEFISQCADNTLVVSGFNYSTWAVRADTDYRGDLVVGQMDDDSALEIATTAGQVFDVETHSLEWTWDGRFGSRVQAADIDGDGRDELIVADGSAIRTFDIEKKLQKWAIPMALSVSAILVADIDRNGTEELLVGDGQTGRVHEFNLQTQIEDWYIPNADWGINNFAVADVNADGVNDVLWGTAVWASTPAHFEVADWRERTIVWHNEQLDGPFIGPEIGDLDGDGVPELVFGSTTSDAYKGGRIVVVDTRTMRVRAISAPVASALGGYQMFELKLRDLNHDGRLDILVATADIEVYSFNAASEFSLVWSARPQLGYFSSIAHSLDVEDVDADGSLEVVATLQINGWPYLYTLDANDGAEEWHTTTSAWDPNRSDRLVVGNLDDDPALEIAVLMTDAGVWVVDGVTREVEAFADVKAHSLATIDRRFGVGSLLIGTHDGHVGAWSPQDGTMTQMASWNFGPSFIVGAELTHDGALAVATNYAIKTLREGTISTTSGYDSSLGRTLLSYGTGRILFTASGIGVHAFIVRP